MTSFKKVRHRLIGTVLFLLMLVTARTQAMVDYDSVWSRARLLPSGQTVVGLRGHLSVEDGAFDQYGQQQSSGQELTQKFRIKDSLPESMRGNLEVEKYLLNKGLSQQAVISVTEFEVERKDFKHVWSWAHGLTSNWMIGLRLPFLNSEAKVNEKHRYTRAYRTATKVSEGSDAKDLEISKMIKNQSGQLFQQAMNEHEWDSYDSEVSYQGLGDIELLSQWGMMRNYQYAFSLRQRITVPTSRAPDPYQFIQLSSADGQMDLGLDTLLDWSPSKRWTFTGILGYTAQLPDQVSARVPDVDGNRVQGEVDQNVNRDLGDMVSAQVLSHYRFSDQFWLVGSYSLEVKARDSYSGEELANTRYEFLEENSTHEAHVGHLGLRYVMRDGYWRQGRGQQVAANLGISSVLMGKNYPVSRSASFDIELYF